MSHFASKGEYPCWIIKRGDEYLEAPHWRLWGDGRLVTRFRTREEAESYLFPEGDPEEPDAPPERIVKLVKKSGQAPGDPRGPK